MLPLIWESTLSTGPSSSDISASEENGDCIDLKVHTLWHLDDKLIEFFPDLAQMAYAHLSSIRAYYGHSKGKQKADEIWIKHSLSKKPGLMERLETLGQLARTEPAPIIEAFLKERASIDISALEAIALTNPPQPEAEPGFNPV